MMTSQNEHVFGRGRLKMATGEHVEVYREAVAPGERRRYTKRFLATSDADFGQWTEREWRILARLIGHGIHCVPNVVQFDGGAQGGIRLVQTYDAGVTVDQWATLLPVSRDGASYRHIFEDCAHWWSLAHCCLAALDEIHSLGLVHLDIKGDNICIPYGPPSFDPDAGEALFPIFQRLALIDFAFSVVSGENLSSALPIGWQKDYDYQSPRLLRALDAGRVGDLQPTKDLDWRCDLYSLAAMLKRYLPGDFPTGETGWTPQRFDDARTLIFRLRECHDRDLPHWRPHQQLMDYTDVRLGAHDLVGSLDKGWQLSHDVPADVVGAPTTPMTRIAPSIHSIRVPRPVRTVTRTLVPTSVTVVRGVAALPVPAAQVAMPPRRAPWRATIVAPMLGALAALAMPSFIGHSDSLDHLVSAPEAASAPDAPRADAAANPAQQAASAEAPASATTPDPAAAVNAAQASVAPALATEQHPSDAKAYAEKEPAAAHAALLAERTAAASRGTPARTKSLSLAARTASKSAAQGSGAHPPASQTQVAKSKRPHGASMAPVAASVNPIARSSVPQDRARVATTPLAAPNADWRTRAPSHDAVPPLVVPIEPAEDAHRIGSEAPANAAAQAPASDSMPERRNVAAAAPANADGASKTASEPHHAAPLPAPATGNSQAPRASGGWQAFLANLGNMLRRRESAPAPVEERRVLQPPSSVASAPTVRSSPRVDDPAIGVASTAQANASNHAVTNAVTAAPVILPASPTIVAARAGDAPLAIAPAPGSTPVEGVDAEMRADGVAQDVLAMQARRMLAEVVPRVATQAQPDVARVLGLAANATYRSQQQLLVEAANANWTSDMVSIPASDIEPIHARRLHEDARRSFASGRLTEAINTQLRAFAANPRDPDIAAYLAWLHLRTNPVQPEVARQLAVYALYVSGARRSARFGDWDILAITSALTGRDNDATRAFFVEVALTSNLDRTCQSALGAYATYGERLRVPVEAMLNRVDASGRISPYCDRRPAWNSVATLQ